MQVIIPCRGRSIRTQSHQKGNKVFYKFNGKYFLSYIIEWLNDQGFNDILIMYNHEDYHYIIDLFNSGCKFEFEGGSFESIIHSLILAQKRIDDKFILMMGDNYYLSLNLNNFIEQDTNVVSKSLPQGGYFIDNNFVKPQHSRLCLGIFKLDKNFITFCENNEIKDVEQGMNNIKHFDYQGISFDIGSVKGIMEFKNYTEDQE